jgi:hypothetical protein
MKFFQKYLSVWVILCMIIGVSIGHFFPMIPNILNKFEYAGISIPMAVLIWIMIYPMMIKVDFKSVKYISKNPKGLFVTWIVNWLIKPFTMYGIAYVACYLLKLPHNIAAPAGMIGASNFFELAVAVAIALFGTTSEAALAIIDGTGPLSTDGTWGNHMQFTSKAIGELGAINGPRCCKRDAMIAFKNGIDYVNAHYGVTLQYEQMQCGFTDFNEQCIKERCPFHE